MVVNSRTASGAVEWNPAMLAPAAGGGPGQLHTPTHLPTRAELRALIARQSDDPGDARSAPDSGIYVSDDRRSSRGVMGLRHYVIVWDAPHLGAPVPMLRDLEERVLRMSRAAQLDSDLPAGCTIAGAIVDASLEPEEACELMAMTRRRWPGVPLMMCGSTHAPLERRALLANGIYCHDASGASIEEAMRTFVMRSVAQRLAQCQRFDTRMAHWGLSEKEAQMIVLLALGMSECALTGALETTPRYLAQMRRSMVEKTSARDVFGVLARLTG